MKVKGRLRPLVFAGWTINVQKQRARVLEEGQCSKTSELKLLCNHSETQSKENMNGYTLMGVCLCACAFLAMAGPPINKAGGGPRVVFEFAGEPGKQQEALLNNVENVLRALGPSTRIVVVAHGEGLALLQNPGKAMAARMETLISQHVSFAACENTMRRLHLTKSDLLPFASTVDSGVAEVVRRQEAGWRYIRSG